jgi:PAS domain S-box-containing protein
MTQEAMLEAEWKLRNIVEHSTNLFYMHTVDNILTYVSPQSRQFFDCEPEEALVRWTEFITDNPVNRAAIDATQRAIDTGQRQPPYQVECIGKTGRKIWVEANETPVVEKGKTVAIVGSLTDITERKKAEDALRFSEERYRALFRDNPTMIVTLDAELTMLSVNPVCVSQLGFTIDELEGQSVLKLFHEDDRPALTEQLRLCLQNPDQVHRWQFRKIRKDGVLLWVDESAQAVYDLNGALNILVVCQDITERKQAEEALRESENKFSKAFQATPSVLVIASLADGRYIEVNEAFELAMGYSRDEVLGCSSLKFNIWQNREDRAMVLRMLAEGKKVRDLEIGFRSKSGAIIVGLYSAEIIEIGAEQCLLSLVNDITARKKAEEELRHSEERYRLLYNDTPVMLHSIDHDGRLVGVSNYWLETLGYARIEVLGRPLTEFLTPASRSYATEVVFPEFFRTGSCKEVPYQIVKKNGEMLDVNLSAIAERDSEGKVVRSLAVMVDVTERNRAEEALRKSEKKFLTVFHAVPAILGITTPAEGRFVDVNETCMRILGYQRDEVIGYTALELGIWERQADRERALKALEEHGTVRDIEISLRGKTGENFVGLMSAEFIEIDDERYILSMINDITERKRMEEEIKRLNTDLAARAVELEAANLELETFNYTVAHDLRKPLTAVNGYCQAVKELCGDMLDEACKRYLREAYDGTWRMNQLIDALLNFSRLSHIEPRREMVDFSAMAHVVAAELQLAEPERRVTFRIADGVSADGDAALLRVVLDNLLGNAWKYTGTRDEGIIEFGTTEVDGKPAYFVRDNGAGFAMADADKLFAPFQRLPGAEEYRGFGIGLATVDRIIRRHGGRVWAAGKPGKGATFYFTLGDD